VLHPVAHLSKWFLMTPSNTTKFQYVNSPFFIFLLTHYMFRPLRAIFRWDIQLKKLHGLSPRANYTDRATAATRRSGCQLLRIEGATWSAWSLRPYSRISRKEPLLFYKVAPQLYSRGWVDPVPDRLLLFFFDSAGNRTRASGFIAKNSDH
jgi:hypothetical protein